MGLYADFVLENLDERGDVMKKWAFAAAAAAAEERKDRAGRRLRLPTTHSPSNICAWPRSNGATGPARVFYVF